MVKAISAISELLGAISLLLAMAFLWRFGPSMGRAIQQLAHAFMTVVFVRYHSQASRMTELLQDLNSLSMANVTSSQPTSDHNGLGYNVGYFARKHRISRVDAEKLINRVGNDRDKLNRAAERLKAAASR